MFAGVTFAAEFSTLLIQIVYFHESNAGGIVYTAYDRSVVTCWQLYDHCRLPSVRRRQPTGDDIAHLAVADEAMTVLVPGPE